ncbi:MAG TPA: hypothetical protein VK517_07765 [Cyclobacteriaceae bacterium]|nr:hypothetical protein [Cyclobacteriaceae bacterium]
MRKILIFLFAYCFIVTGYSQKKPRPATDSILHNQQIILKQLREMGRRDSMNQISNPDPHKPLWDYVEDLQNDTHQHREFIQDYYDKIYLTVTVMLTLFGGLLGFLGFQSYKQIEKRLSDIFESRFNKRFEKLWKEKSVEVDEKINGLLDEIARHQEINKEQTNQINFLDQVVSEIKKNIHVERSAVMLEYVKPDGSELVFYREQEITCSSKEYPIHETEETIEIEAPGKVEFIEGTKNELASAVSKNIPNGCKITMTFKSPLVMGAKPFVKFVKCKLVNGFLKQHEQFMILQPYPCDHETFEIKFRKEKNCKKIWVERLSQSPGGEEKFEAFDSAIQTKEVEDYYSHKIELPRSEGPFGSPRRYIIHWEF